MPALSWRPDGSFRLDPLPAWLFELLAELPELLASEDEAVRARWAPRPADDPERCADWERLVVPELFHLIASSKEIVETDLEAVVELPDRPGSEPLFSLEVPRVHVDAWIHALNAARLALGELFELEATDLDGELHAPAGPRELAIEKVHLYGWIQHQLVEGGARP